ncbi:metallophosphoesterase [Paenibacillus albicereus]|uniref:Metallophosphoesterase n=1 Tax=Paenibacillus albicereus TaxID=2726185 RepID=A0A6H2GUL7_9BACL|nr:metallophosphoesterase [Paenibacillus albicereus]QJC51085.1 metallophosphoesterase [Paenibacillus albicereus]
MKLIVMGDLHYHEFDETVAGLQASHEAYYGKLMERFFEQDADLHISLGDLTNFGTERELREIYGLIGRWTGRADRRFVHVLGNHDLYAQPRADVLAQTGQPRYSRVETDLAMLAFLDTARDQDLLDWGGWIDDEQLDWLEETVVASGDKPLLVFGHHPVYATTARSEGDMGSIHRQVDMWRALGRKQGIGLYFNGHTHVDSIASRDNWTFVQLAACLDVPSFRVVEIGPESIEVSAAEALDEEIVSGSAAICAHMHHFRQTPGARGEQGDREIRIALKDGASLTG